MRTIWILSIAIFCISACSKEEGPGDVNIRLSNVSDQDFKNIVVNTSTGNVSFGTLESGEFSDYKSFELAYRYAYIELTANGETYTLQPIDYVGESPLEKGNYTYQLDLQAREQYNSLFFVFLED